MEGDPTKEKVTHVSLDEYVELLVSLNTLDGQVIEDETEAFYWWVTKTFTPLQDIDGVSLHDLYKINVVDGDMTKDRFYGYCIDHEFPFPSTNTEQVETILNQFNKFLDSAMEEKRQIYEVWAKEHDIDVSPGAVTKFYDTEGTAYRIRTDFEQCGETVE